MPRPKEKPPTEEARIIEINKEFVASYNALTPSDNKLGRVYSFLVKKIAQLANENEILKNKLDEIS